MYDWLKDEAQQWVAKGIIDEDQAASILSQYPKKSEKPDYNLAFIIFGSVAVLLVGSGITLIFAYQWESLNQTWKTVLAILPVLLGLALFVYVWMKKREELVWRECASGFMTLMLAASIGLLGQTYETLANPETYWLFWIILSCPFIYLLNSTMAALLFCFGLGGWVLESSQAENGVFWILLLLFIPHFWINIRKEGNVVRQNLLEWALAITFTVGWFATGHDSQEGLLFFGAGLWMSVFYLIGHYTARKDFLLLRPLQFYAVAASFIMIIVMNFDIDLEPFNWSAPWASEVLDRSLIFTNWICIFLLLLVWVWQGWVLFRQKNRDNISLLFLFFPLVVLGFLRFNQVVDEDTSMLLGSGIGLLYAAIFLKMGVNEQSMILVNIGMLMIIVLASIRFFDADWSMLWKGVVFIVLGLGFLAVNLRLSQSLKKETPKP